MEDSCNRLTLSKPQDQENSRQKLGTPQDNALYISICNSAVAAAAFLNKEGELICNIKHLKCDLIIVTYCLKQSIDCTWFVNYVALKDKEMRHGTEVEDRKSVTMKSYPLPGRI